MALRRFVSRLTRFCIVLMAAAALALGMAVKMLILAPEIFGTILYIGLIAACTVAALVFAIICVCSIRAGMCAKRLQMLKN